VLLVSEGGKAWRNRVGFVPEKALYEQIGLRRGERLAGVGVLTGGPPLLVVGTRLGKIKRTLVSDLSGIPGAWFPVVGLPEEGDGALFAALASDDAEVVFVTSGGQVLRTAAGDVNPQASGSARGVAGIGLKRDDALVAGAVVHGADVERTWLFIVTEEGFVKRVPLTEYPKQGRAGQGVQTLRVTPTTGKLAAAAFGTQDDGFDVIFGDGKRFSMPAVDVPAENRYNQGKRLVPVWEAEAVVVAAAVL
jgi:DNA gyrase subunit A